MTSHIVVGALALIIVVVFIWGTRSTPDTKDNKSISRIRMQGTRHGSKWQCEFSSETDLYRFLQEIGSIDDPIVTIRINNKIYILEKTKQEAF